MSIRKLRLTGCVLGTTAMLALGCGSSDKNTQASSPQTSYAETTPATTAPSTALGQDTTTYHGQGAATQPGATQPGSTTGSNTSTTDTTQGGTQGVYGATGQTGSTGQYGSVGSMGQNGATGASGSMNPTGPGSSATVTDQDIAAIVIAANKGEIKEAQLAQTKAQSADVKRFAANMIAQHTQMLRDAQGVGVTPATGNEQVQRMEGEVKQQMDDWKSKTGKDFDKAYMDAQVEAHQKVLRDIDAMMIPNAKSPALKAALATARTHVEAHLQDAQRIQAKLSGNTADSTKAP